ncbi:SRPBCC family protein [Diaminobutyricibacter sp. McL0608]|uniref:SRPBCC family protein n=1 Tax=Leifsonia sp. McL0608 TaxID=3143537 RepID=UPI0031F31AF0
MKSIRTITTDVARPPSAVFALLADLPGFGAWLDPSSTYHATVRISDDPIVEGTTYTDEIQGMQMHGTVVRCEPDHLLVFHQARSDGHLAITISYELAPVPEGTRVVRTGEIVTGGFLAALHPIVVRTTVKENQRMMTRLKEYLEGGTGE